MKSSRDEMDLDEVSLSLLDLPIEIDYEIVNQAPDNEATQIMATLSNTCWQLHGFFQPELDQRAAKQLLTYVLQGNAAKAKAMYTANPGLLFIETSAEEYAAGIDEDGKAVHRTIEESPFRAMLGAGDIGMLEEIPADYYDLVIDKENSKTFRQLAAEQFAEQFPNGFDYPASTYDFSLLVDAITKDQQLIQTGIASPITQEILAQFRNDFMPGRVRDGHHFNLNELKKAYEVYDQNWKPWNGEQLSLFGCQVIGYLERLVTAVDAQVLSQGIGNLNAGKPVKRNFELINHVTHRKISYFPLDSDPSCRLGLNFLVNSCEGDRRDIGDLAPSRFQLVYHELCQTKATGLENIMQQLRQQPSQLSAGRKQRGCVIF